MPLLPASRPVIPWPYLLQAAVSAPLHHTIFPDTEKEIKGRRQKFNKPDSPA
jgi:hypothetical protein